MNWTADELKILVAFYAQYEPKAFVACDRCQGQVPGVAYLTPVAKTNALDENGMPEETENICDGCLEPMRLQQEQTDAQFEL